MNTDAIVIASRYSGVGLLKELVVKRDWNAVFGAAEGNVKHLMTTNYDGCAPWDMHIAIRFLRRTINSGAIR